MAGWRGSFGENVDFVYGQRSFGRQLDITGGLERGLSGIGGIGQTVRRTRDELKDLNKELTQLNHALDLAEDAKEFARLERAITKTEKAARKLRDQMANLGFDRMEQMLGRLTKGLLAFNTSLLGLGFGFVIDSLKRVYELQERWARAIGGFNMQLGGMTKGLAGATVAATKWSSTIRGLTNGDIQEGIQMFTEFTNAIGRVVKEGDEFSKVGIQLARGFNLGGTGAGQLLKVMQNIGESGDDVTKLFGADLVKAANAAGVPVNMLAKDIQDSDTYMARFGKDSAKTFIQGAAFARKFTITMRDLQNSVQGFDMFDNAASTAASLNTIFGTAINAMDLMMEDDPAKRIDMIRQQFLMLGKTEDKMSPKEIRALSEKLKLTEDQTRSLFSLKNAGISYQQFQVKAAASEKEEADAKRNMELQLRKTAQTLFAFGAAFDRITLAIAKAISPILQVFGLAKTGGKDFKSFGQVMEGVTGVVERFFTSLAGNPRWMGFMRTLADDLVRAGHALRDFVMSGRAADFVGHLADSMKSFYTSVRDFAVGIIPRLKPLGEMLLFLAKHFMAVAAAWGAMKGINTLGSFFSGGTGGMLKGAAGLIGKMGVRGAKGAAGVGLGLTTAGILGGTGATIGGALGGLAGAFVPFIGPLMGPLGAALGKGIETLFSGSHVKTKLEKAMDDLTDAQKKGKILSERLLAAQELAETRRTALRNRQSDADKMLLELGRQKSGLTQDELGEMRWRIMELQGFGKHTALVTKALNDLGHGPLSKDEMGAISEAERAYTATTEKLDAQSQQLLQDKGLEAELTRAQNQQSGLKYKIASIPGQLADLEKSHKQNLDDMTKPLKDAAKKYGRESPEYKKLLGIASDRISAENDRYQKRHAELLQEKIDDQTKLQEIGNKIMQKQLDVAIKQAVMATDLYTKNASLITSGKMSASQLVGMALPMLASETGFDASDISQAYGIKMASGGIVTRPTRALIGEAGPEAVIPLRAMARGRMSPPPNQGGPISRQLVTGGGDSTRVVSSVADVNLDGQKVGSVVVQTYITGRR